MSLVFGDETSVNLGREVERQIVSRLVSTTMLDVGVTEQEALDFDPTFPQMLLLQCDTANTITVTTESSDDRVLRTLQDRVKELANAVRERCFIVRCFIQN